jgi:16S rRNA (guanine1207-N2)-methyltransferase
MQVLDLGCGSGAVALAAACRAPEVRVWAADSNARAVECVAWNCRRNSLGNIQVVLDADGRKIPSHAFDLVLANPPYYSQHRIAELFVRTAQRALVPHGRLLLVTKHLAWYEAHLPSLFGTVETWQDKGYFLLAADRPRSAADGDPP